jgi:5-methylcytosine-specific restriction endonuclease McrA
MTDKNKNTWKRYGNKLPSNDKECFYCKGKLWHDNRTTDHLVPKSRGGILSNDNKVFACKRCNSFKKDYDVEMFHGMVKFYISEKEKEFRQSIEYYTEIKKNLDKLIDNRVGKAKKSIPGNKKRG